MCQLYCIDQGEYDLEQIRIEDAPIRSFEEIDYDIVQPGEAPNQVLLQDGLDCTPYTGELQEHTHTAFGAGEKWSTLARITAVRPRGELAEISTIAANPVVHTAD